MLDNRIEQRTLDFAVTVTGLYRELQERRELVLSKHLLRCGTGIGATLGHAPHAESRKEFEAIMTRASRQAHETKYWLWLLQQSGVADLDVRRQLLEVDEIIVMLNVAAKDWKSAE